ncbi:MAG: glycosyltransferase family 2 protein, partial [Actinomycetota bacterium]
MSGRGLRGRIGSRVRALTGADETAAARVELAMLRAEIATESARLDDLAGALAAATAGLTESRTRFEEVLAVELAHRRETVDDIPRLREQLRAARTDPDYDAAFDEADPLVTVRIASYQRTQELLEVALPSAFDQTHRNLEIVIVNDGPNPATREALDALDDPRVRYHELPERGRYPEHPLSRWRVAGTPAGNRGLELATGRWIAPLDEDDAFTPDHVEVLLALARDRRAELAYGAVRQHNVVTGEDRTIWSDP